MTGTLIGIVGWIDSRFVFVNSHIANKLFKNDSQRVAFLLCVAFSV